MRIDLVEVVVVDFVLDFGLGVGLFWSAVKLPHFIIERLAGDGRKTGCDSGQEEDGLKFHKVILLLKLKSVD